MMTKSELRSTDYPEEQVETKQLKQTEEFTKILDQDLSEELEITLPTTATASSLD